MISSLQKIFSRRGRNSYGENETSQMYRNSKRISWTIFFLCMRTWKTKRMHMAATMLSKSTIQSQETSTKLLCVIDFCTMRSIGFSIPSLIRSSSLIHTRVVRTKARTRHSIVSNIFRGKFPVITRKPPGSWNAMSITLMISFSFQGITRNWRVG